MKQYDSSRSRARLLIKRDIARRFPTTESAETSKPRKSIRRWSRYVSSIRPFLFEIVLLFSLSLLSVVFGLIQPLASRYITDNIIFNKSLSSVAKLRQLEFATIAVVSLLLAAYLLETFRSWRLTAVSARLVLRLRNELFKRFVRLPLSDLYAMKVGETVSRLTTDISSLSLLLEKGLLTPVVEFIRVSLTVAILFFVNWRLALFSLLVLPLITAISMILIHRLRPIFSSIHTENAAFSSWLTELLAGIRVVRSYNREQYAIRRHAIYTHTLVRASLYTNAWQTAIEGSFSLLIPLSLFALFSYGSYLIIAGSASLGDLMAVMLYIPLTLEPILRIVSAQSSIQSGLAAAERLYEALDRQIEIQSRARSGVLPTHIQEICFKGVHFSYVPGIPILKGVDLVIPNGSSVAIVGRSGTGKTTIGNLLARLYDPSAGSVRLNNIDIRDFRLEEYRKLLAFVEQDVFLFDGSVRDNIKVGKPSATNDEVCQAAANANAHNFILGLPNGYETEIGERGAHLSGGQRQRISIARAFLSDSPIIVLDEATSNLDSESEEAIRLALARLVKTRTAVIIAHRISTIMAADFVAVLDNGVIAECGPHSALELSNGIYAGILRRHKEELAL